MHFWISLSLAVAITSTAALSQQPGPLPRQVNPASPSQLSPEVRAEIIDTVAAEISRFYAVADTGQLIAEHLRKRLGAHAYDALTDPRIFAEAVTVDLQAISHDKHLALTLRGQSPATPLGTPRSRCALEVSSNGAGDDLFDQELVDCVGAGRCDISVRNEPRVPRDVLDCDDDTLRWFPRDAEDIDVLLDGGARPIAQLGDVQLASVPQLLQKAGLGRYGLRGDCRVVRSQ